MAARPSGAPRAPGLFFGAEPPLHRAAAAAAAVSTAAAATVAMVPSLRAGASAPAAASTSSSSSSSRAAATQSASRSALPPTTEEWEAKRTVIKDLYINQGLKLTEVVQMMETRYGFRATERMYKGRFSKWGIRKNSRRATEILRPPQDDGADDEDEIAIEVPELAPAPQRTTAANVVALASAMPTASTSGALVARPSAEVIAGMPTAIPHADLESQLREEIFLSINYTAETFYDQPARPSAERFAVANFISLTRLGLRQVALKNEVFGGRMLTRARGLLDEAHLCRNPPNIINMCFVLPALMIRLGQPDLFRSYVENLAAVTGERGPGSPMHQIAARLIRLLVAAAGSGRQADALLLHLSNASITIYLGKERNRRLSSSRPPWDAFPNSESDLMMSIESVHNTGWYHAAGTNAKLG